MEQKPAVAKIMTNTRYYKKFKNESSRLDYCSVSVRTNRTPAKPAKYSQILRNTAAGDTSLQTFFLP